MITNTPVIDFVYRHQLCTAVYSIPQVCSSGLTRKKKIMKIVQIKKVRKKKKVKRVLQHDKPGVYKKDKEDPCLCHLP